MGIIVVGMHRSGTSAVTRAIRQMGASIAIDQIGPMPENPDGFYESRSLTDFNEGLLGQLGGRWDAPPPMGTGWTDGCSLRLYRQASKIFRRAHHGSHWTWKDPRNCVLLPFWQRVLGDHHPIVMTFRDPRSVAESLERRNGLTTSYALALWERHLRHALQNLTGRTVLVTSYDRLLDDPDYRRTWVESVWVMSPDVTGDPEQNFIEVSRVFKRELRHHCDDEASMEVDQELSVAQRHLYAKMRELTGLHLSLLPSDLGPETESTEPALAAHRWCGQSNRCLHRTSSQLALAAS